MGAMMKNFSSNDSQNGSELTFSSRNPSSVGASTAIDAVKSNKRKPRNSIKYLKLHLINKVSCIIVSVNLDSLLGSGSAQNSALLATNIASNNESANTSHEFAVGRPTSARLTNSKNIPLSISPKLNFLLIIGYFRK